MKLAFGALLTLGLLGMTAAARADEEKIPLKDVPKAVLDAVKARYPGAELKGAEKEVEDGKTTYEIALTDKGKSIDVSLTAEGKVTAIETVVAIADLPKAVTEAVQAKYPKGTLRKAEEIVEFQGDKETRSYEVIVATEGGKSVEVKLTPDGKVLEVEDD